MQKDNQAKTVSMRRSVLWFVLLFALTAGLIAGSQFFLLVQPDLNGKPTGTDREGNSSLIRTASDAKKDELQRANTELRLLPFRYKVQAFMNDRITKHKAAAVSLFFQDLYNGTWFGIGEKEKIFPKKFPLMIAYFKWAESNPLVLNKVLTYIPSQNSASQKTHLQPGNQYSIRDLIFRMITEDDSTAYSLLSTAIPPAALEKIYQDLNAEYDPRRDEFELTLRSFAGFYRALFNASYLNKDMSEKALTYLAKDSIKHGIVHGVPFDIAISGRIGEHTVQTTENGKEFSWFQLQEFGIIYHPRRPFLIGIVVRGDDANSLSEVLRDTTEVVYQEIDSQS